MGNSGKVRHFLDFRDFDRQTLEQILQKAKELKASRNNHEKWLADKKLAMVFEKPSTRTRVSFEVGMVELGGHALHLSKNDIQLGHGESIADTARVLSRMVDLIMLRCHAHDTLLELAKNSRASVINGLTDYNHPCQLMADILTVMERKGSITGKTIAWVGDGNNMANSWIAAAERFGFTLRLACPAEIAPCPKTVAWAQEQKASVYVGTDVQTAVRGADVVVTDTWVSMGQKDGEWRKRLLASYQVNEALMALAAKDAIFLHCLPAHRGEEVTNAVIDSSQSAVWDEAENRLHVQKAIMLWCMEKF